MKRLLLAALAALLCAAPAAAATKYVDATNGNDTWNGTSATFVSGIIGPWRSIGRANTGPLAAGDVVNVAAGTYAHFPAPNVNGSPGAYIRYVGDRADPSNVVVTAAGPLPMIRSYVAVSGFEFTGGGWKFEPGGSTSLADKDSIVWCRFVPADSTDSDISFQRSHSSSVEGPSDNVVYGCFIRVGRVWTNCPSDDCGKYPVSKPRRNVIRRCDIRLTDDDGNRCIQAVGWTDFKIDSNTIRLTQFANTGGVFGLFYLHAGNRLSDNWWRFETKDPDGDAKFYWRDYVYDNKSLRERYENVGPGEWIWYFIGTGSGTTGNGRNKWDGCTWTNLIGQGPEFQCGMQGDTLVNSTFNLFSGAHSDPAQLLGSKQMHGQNLVAGNTISDSLPGGAALTIHAPHCMANGWSGSLNFHSNIIWNRASEASDATAIYTRLIPSRTFKFRYSHNYHYVGHVPMADGTSSIKAGIAKNWRGDWATWDSTYTCLDDPPYGCAGTGTDACCGDCADPNVEFESVEAYNSKPNANPWLADIAATSHTPLDSLSTFVAKGAAGTGARPSPLFVDSTRVGFNPQLAAGSGAIGMGELGTNAGSYNPPDMTRPAPISNLRIRTKAPTSAYLEFTAVGDDSLTGRARVYEVRYSTTPITTDAAFNAATQFVALNFPKLAGSIDNINVNRLAPNTKYYFSVKAIDDAENRGAISTATTGTTPPPYPGGGGQMDP